MKKCIFLALAIALLVAAPGAAWAKFRVAISDDLIPQQVAKEVPVTVKIHPTIFMDTLDPTTGEETDTLQILCLNPHNNSVGTTVVRWDVKSNLPFWKTLRWSGMQTDYMLRSPMPDGSWEMTRVQDLIGPDRTLFYLSDDTNFTEDERIRPYPNGWVGPIIGDKDHHEDIEYLLWRVDVQWCDSAGYYDGLIWLDAHQN